MPRVVSISSPTPWRPLSSGRRVFIGADGSPTGLASENADVAPPALRAITSTLSVRATSSEDTRYELSVAPAMMPQLLPRASQRHQRWSRPIVTTPVQVPSSASSSSPSATRPVIVGGARLTGGLGCTTPVAGVVIEAVPPPLVALTTTRSVEPTSAVVTT